jgi:hypothetical protein
MNNNGANFELVYKGSKIKVKEHKVAGQTIFRIVFPDGRKPLVVTRATGSNYTDFWTSVPEGRQQEAEEIGALISEYLNIKQ